MKLALILVILIWVPVQLVAQDGGQLNSNKRKTSTDSSLTIGEMISRAKEIGLTDTSAADKMFRKAIAKAINVHDTHSAGKAYYEMGEMYFRHKNHNKSFGSFLNAKEYFGQSGSQKDIAFANYAIGRQQYYRGNYKLAAGHLNYAMKRAKELKLKNLESNILEYMGILYFVMPNPGYQSTDLLKKSLEIKRQLENQNGELRILEKLAAIYFDQREFDSGLFYSNASLVLAEKLGLKYDANLTRLSQIPVFLRLNKEADAKERLSFIKAHVLDSSDLNMRIRYYIQAGNYHVALQDTVTAQKNYDSALQVAQNTGFPEMYSLVYKNMAGAYYYSKDFKKAYEYQSQFANKMASWYTQENLAIFKELEYLLKTNITEDEVKYLSVQNEVKAARLKNEKTLRLILLIGSSVLLLSAAIIFVLYRKQKRKGHIIEKQGVDLQILMKEIHHRVKNNLQVISSLLDLQSLTIGDMQAAQAIKESRNRVKSMALIHQNLYGENNVKGIAVDNYIGNLAQSLFNSYNIRPGQVDLRTEIEKLELDVDTVIPIGLLLNEIISNSLKYAFGNDEGGKIEVTLKRNNGILFLQVKDNGKGFPGSTDPIHSTSFGMRMIKIFAQKLKADLDIYNDQGACITMRIRNFKMANNHYSNLLYERGSRTNSRG